MIRAIRGATTVENNDEQEIIAETEQLLKEMIRQNDVQAEDVVSVLISATEDLNATFPAKALRNIAGWTYVPVMCMREINVPNSLPKCIRVMMTVHTEASQRDVRHVYLRKAIQLRPDLSLTEKSEM
ncbi:chorismate mutase [Thermolongibacillus altinsuensis]|jgi:chorismate mutase|uniref:chorismate mutase n=1 Tax=Thermolongibacillus altinsuensis TaxID=575256 RepID=A0A4R1QJZ8_9BACL|nr:chorismate mutase [Thermolongibacillus altinsuensis]TCL53173.1 chorismate mutase [Thermolongibacillus altinsuensis]GMB07875.1 chorismate mutase AroH [Thermolongibacillus altinsuensis]